LISSFLPFFNYLISTLFSLPTGPRKCPFGSQPRIHGSEKQIPTRGKTSPRRTSRAGVQIKRKREGRREGGREAGRRWVFIRKDSN